MLLGKDGRSLVCVRALAQHHSPPSRCHQRSAATPSDRLTHHAVARERHLALKQRADDADVKGRAAAAANTLL